MNQIVPPTLKSLDVSGKRVLVRGDFDVDDGDNPRANSIRSVVALLLANKAAAIRVIGHTETKFDLASMLKPEFPTVEFFSGVRLDAREKENSEDYAREMSEGWDIYVNEAFATSHRKHASIVAIPQVMRLTGRPAVLGPRFVKELEMLAPIWEKTGKRVLVIGGVKVEDKQKFAEMHADKFANVLKGGLLPGVKLRPDGLDISDETIEEYKAVIRTAEVILAAGVMGKYEDPNCEKGTKEVLTAIAVSNAYKVAGGGDIEMAISAFGLTDKFDWISVGGGAMLEYLGKGTLPGIEALMN
jgi:phosphoglycerate kinase